MIKGSTQEEDITIVTIYVPNIGALQYIRQTLIAITGDTSSNTIMGETLSPHLYQWTNHLTRKSVRKHRP